MSQTNTHTKCVTISTNLAHTLINAMNTDTECLDNKTIEVASVSFDDSFAAHIAIKTKQKKDANQNPLYMIAELYKDEQMVYCQTSNSFKTKWNLTHKNEIYQLYLTWDEIEPAKEEPPLHVFFDMDNTLSQLTGELDKKYQGKRPIDTEEHYFRQLKPNPNMKQLVQKLDCTQNVTQYVITHTTEHDAKRATEHMYDKYVWRLKHYPEFKTENVIFIPNQSVSKADAVKLLFNRELTPQDILIDDYNDNLIAWRNAGGTAIKLCNGQNNPDSYDGPKFLCHTENTSVNEYLTILVNSIKCEKIINLQDSRGFILNTFCIKNYNKNFDKLLDKLLDSYQFSNLELTAYIHPKIKSAGYVLEEIPTIDVTVP